MMTLRALLVLVFLLLLNGSAFSQANTAVTTAIEPTMVIDKPTAGMLHRGTYELDGNFFEQGGVLFGVSVGLFDRFNFGISYGGTDVLGINKPTMNPYPGVNVKLRVLEESTIVPAIAVGFDWQGKGVYVEDLKRYVIKSTGFYVVGSHNFAFAGNLSVHGGVNLSTENGDGDGDLDLFVGAEKSLGADVSILAEYDPGWNDNSGNALGRFQGRGYFNMGLRWNWGRGLVLGLNLKDIFKNQQNVTVGSRTIQFNYVGSF